MNVDARTPLVFDVHALIGRPGAYERIDVAEPADPGIATDVVRVAEDATVRLTGLLESVREGILVTGRASATGRSECSRCLDPVEVPIAADLQELYVWSANEAVPNESGERLPYLDADLLDLRPAVRDGLILDMPLAPLCSPDCPGLCPECGQRLRDDPDHRHEATDSRWAALNDLRDRLHDEQSAPTSKER